MPIEIRELQITAVVQDSAAQNTSAASTRNLAADAGMIAECVEQVLEILKQKNER